MEKHVRLAAFPKPQHFSIFAPKPTIKRLAEEIDGGQTDDFNERWGNFGDYMQAKKRKLLEQFHDAADRVSPPTGGETSNIFHGICIHVNGHTNPNADELKTLMMLHGGTYHLYYNSRKTTHIVASILPYTKIVQLKGEKVAKPEWITESIKAGRLLPWERFELYPKNGNKPPTKDFSSELHQDSLARASKAPGLLAKAEKAGSSDGQTVAAGNKSAHSVTTVRGHQQRVEFPGSESGAPISPPPAAEHNRENPFREAPPVAHKAGDPNYLQQFYSRSRLHHLSLWKVEAKQLVQTLQEKSNSTFPGRQNLKEHYNLRSETEFRGMKTDFGTVRMHIDFDCFFVSVGLLSRPHLKGKPVAVCHGRSGQGKLSKQPDEPVADEEEETFGSRSEVSSCNYEARKAGLRNGMYLGPAKQMCPELVTITYEFDKYKEISTIFYEIIASYTLDIEAISCDEMIVDCTEVLKETGATPWEFAAFVRKEIYERTGCHASAGLGANPLIARLATKKAKPDGHLYVSNDEVSGFMADIPIQDIPGAGSSADEKFERLGVATCGDLLRIPLKLLQTEFGPKNGQKFYDFARGIDHKEVQNTILRKSVSADVNYGIRMKVVEEFISFFGELSEEIHRRMVTAQVVGQTITLKLLVRHPDAPFEPAKYMGCGKCNAVNRSVTLIQPTDAAEIVAREGVALFRKMDVDVREVRGIGVQITRLVDSKSLVTGGQNRSETIAKFFRHTTSTKTPMDSGTTPSAAFGPGDENGDSEPMADEDVEISCAQPVQPSMETQVEVFTSQPVRSDDGISSTVYDLIAEIGWNRVFRKLTNEVDQYLMPVGGSSAIHQRDHTESLLKRFSIDGEVLVDVVRSTAARITPVMFDEEILAGHYTGTPLNLSNIRGLSAKELFYESDENLSFGNVVTSTALQELDKEFPPTQYQYFLGDIANKPQSPTQSDLFSLEEAPLDEALRPLFDEMYEDVECKFWLNYFDIAEEPLLTMFPSTMYGATLSYLDAPKVIRHHKNKPVVLWAVWHLNAVYRKRWLERLLGRKRKRKGPRQQTLKMRLVTATQAAVQRQLPLRVKGHGDGRPVRKSGKVQAKLQLAAPPEEPGASTSSAGRPCLLPSPSQVDPDFLVAMPQEILDEIFVLYERKDSAPFSRGRPATTNPLSKQKILTIGKSRDSSENTRRPRKKSQSKLRKPGPNQPAIDSFFSINKKPMTSHPITSCSQESKRTNREDSTPFDHSSTDLIVDFTTQPAPKAKPAPPKKLLLFGKSAPKDIASELEKVIIASHTETAITEALVAILDGWLTQGRLSQVDFLLKRFFRDVDEIGDQRRDGWIASYETVTKCVRVRSLAVFGSSLQCKGFEDFGI